MWKIKYFLTIRVRLVSIRQLIAVTGGAGHLKKRKHHDLKYTHFQSPDLLPVGAADLVTLAVQGIRVTEAVSVI